MDHLRLLDDKTILLQLEEEGRRSREEEGVSERGGRLFFLNFDCHFHSLGPLMMVVGLVDKKGI